MTIILRRNMAMASAIPRKGAKTKFYKLLVRNQQMAAMKVELKAETQRDAVRYGKARWPGCCYRSGQVTTFLPPFLLPPFLVPFFLSSS